VFPNPGEKGYFQIGGRKKGRGSFPQRITCEGALIGKKFYLSPRVTRIFKREKRQGVKRGSPNFGELEHKVKWKKDPKRGKAPNLPKKIWWKGKLKIPFNLRKSLKKSRNFEKKGNLAVFLNPSFPILVSFG